MNIKFERWARLLGGVLLCMNFVGTAIADEMEGTWRLITRKLPDGTVLQPPAVQGMSTMRNGVNELIVFWPTPSGGNASLSQISAWEWSAISVIVTPMLMIFDDGSGKPPVYQVGGETKRSSIARKGTTVSYQHPLNQPFIVRDGNKSTATVEGAFTDYWERVEQWNSLGDQPQWRDL